MSDNDTSAEHGAELRQRALSKVAETPALTIERPDPLSPEVIGQMLHELRVHQIELEMQNDELRRTQNELEASRTRYVELYDLAPVGYCTVSEAGLIWQANFSAASLLGVARGVLVKQPLTRFIFKDDQDSYYLLRKRLIETGEPQWCDLRLLKNDGTLFWAQLAATIANDDDGTRVLRIVLNDISERKKLEDAQKEALDLLQKIASRVPGVVYQFRLRPDGSSCFPFASEVLREIYRLSPDEVREDASKMYSALHPEDFEEVKASVRQSAEELTPWQHDYRVKFEDGTVRWLSGNAIPEREADGGVLWHGFITDITERKVLEERVRQMAFIDVLTNLPNRRLLNDRLSQAMASSTRSGYYGALMFLDLDNFKPLNDTYGHSVGDQLLVEAANRLKHCVREIDTVARFGGDEFVVMIGELEMSKAGATAKACLVAEKIQIALSEPYSLRVPHDGTLDQMIKHQCTASIGLNLFIGNDVSQDEVLLRADKAMYQAKEAGRNSIQIASGPPQRVGLSKTAPENFVQLAWHSDYECGNALIDNQHRALFGDANRLITAILSERQTAEVSALIDDLVRDVVQHFTDEEGIFGAAGFTGAAEHSAIHRQLIDRAMVLVDRFHAGTLAVGELFQFIAYDVVSRHMLQEDREFFPHLKNT